MRAIDREFHGFQGIGSITSDITFLDILEKGVLNNYNRTQEK
jgi:hypothetical protein